MQQRILNYRPSFNFSSFEQVSGNYYPINTAIAIQDSKLQMTVLNDRAQGGSVLEEGRIELMQNRRLFFDDDRGVEESLDETYEDEIGIFVPATYRLIFNERQRQVSQQRAL